MLMGLVCLLCVLVGYRLSGIPGLVIIKQDGSLITLDGTHDHPDVHTLANICVYTYREYIHV